MSFDLEGTVALGDQLSMVELYYDLGVRWMLMAYNKKNSVGGGCLEDSGLTSFGRAVLDEMRGSAWCRAARTRAGRPRGMFSVTSMAQSSSPIPMQTQCMRIREIFRTNSPRPAPRAAA